jgi:hypothetical protein
MPQMVFAYLEPKPETEALIVHNDICWPISTEANAYTLAKKVGAPGFWRLKSRRVVEPTSPRR